MGCFVLLPMRSIAPLDNPPLLSSPPPKLAPISGLRSGFPHRRRQFHILQWLCAPNPRPRPPSLAAPGTGIPEEEEDEEEPPVRELRVPDAWLTLANALQESEWLRVALHKWLDDEYCPEAANVEISKVAANSYYESLMEQQSDIGEILLKMVRDLETVSFQESFHGAFSSANAAIQLIISRMNSMAR